MSESDPQPPVPTDTSPTERRIRRLVVPQPFGVAQSQRIDFIYHPDPELR